MNSSYKDIDFKYIKKVTDYGDHFYNISKNIKNNKIKLSDVLSIVEEYPLDYFPKDATMISNIKNYLQMIYSDEIKNGLVIFIFSNLKSFIDDSSIQIIGISSFYHLQTYKDCYSLKHTSDAIHLLNVTSYLSGDNCYYSDLILEYILYYSNDYIFTKVINKLTNYGGLRIKHLSTKFKNKLVERINNLQPDQEKDIYLELIVSTIFYTEKKRGKVITIFHNNKTFNEKYKLVKKYLDNNKNGHLCLFKHISNITDGIIGTTKTVTTDNDQLDFKIDENTLKEFLSLGVLNIDTISTLLVKHKYLDKLPEEYIKEYKKGVIRNLF